MSINTFQGYRWQLIFVMMIVLAVLLAGCSTTPAETPATQTDREPVVIRLALLRVLDTLPIYVAEQQGYFATNGVQVEIIPVASAPERDQVIASGQADGMVNELMSTLLANREQPTIQVVRIAKAATSEDAVFRIMASGTSAVESVADLQSVEIGISQGTVIEYLTDRLLEAEGYAPDDFPRVNIPSLSDRLALLNSGELAAGMLPEPLSSLAIGAGGRVILDDTAAPEYSYSTIAFRKAFIDDNPEAIRAFLAALEQAVNDLNTNPEPFKPILSERELVPQPLLEGFRIAPYPLASVPSEAQFADALDWAIGKGLIDGNLTYADSVRDDFLP